MYKWGLVLLVMVTGYKVFTPANAEANWDYAIQSFNWNCTDEKIFSSDIRPIRISPGVYGMTGSVAIGADIDADIYQIEIKVSRSPSGTSKYVMVPYQVPKASVSSFFNTVYKKYLMKDLSECAGLPKFEDEWTGPFKACELKVNSCTVDSEALPSHLQSGYYKLIFDLDGPLAHYVGEMIVKIDSKVPSF